MSSLRQQTVITKGKICSCKEDLTVGKGVAICTREEGQEMIDWSTSVMLGRSMGIYVTWGDISKFAIVITQHRNRKVEGFYAESFEKP